MRRMMRAVVMAVVVLSAAWGGGCSEDGPGQFTPSRLRGYIVRNSACTGSDVFKLLYATGAALADVGDIVASILEEIDCVLSAKTCDAVLACEGLDTGTTCDPATTKPKCEGHVRVECAKLPAGGSHVKRSPCADEPYDQKCFVDKLGQAKCGSGTCDGTKDVWCDGDWLHECDDGVEERTDCGAFGLKCVQTGDDATCGTSTPCDVDEVCKGTSFVDCEGGYESLAVDCAWFGDVYTCVSKGDDASCSVPLEKVACTQKEGVCEGNYVKICLGGNWVAFDCGAFLGGTCKTTDDSLFGDGVKCVPGQ